MCPQDREIRFFFFVNDEISLNAIMREQLTHEVLQNC